MKKHRPDWTSGVFGLVFTTVGVGLLIGNLRWEEVNPKAFWAFAIVAAGILILGSALRPLIEGRDQPDS